MGEPATSSAAGPTPALETVYREHHPFVWNSLRRLGVEDASLDDAVHDVFVVVARRLQDFEGRSTMRTWLFSIAMRTAQQHRRTHGRQRRKLEAMRSAAEVVARPDDVARVDAARALRDLLGVLDDEKRTVFILMELEKMTAPEVAAALELKVPTVHSRLRLARKRLTEALAELKQGGEP